jgi:hypothetical protein
MLSRKYYKEFAKMIERTHENISIGMFTEAEGLELLENEMIRFFVGDNPRFDVAKFRAEAGIQ